MYFRIVSLKALGLGRTNNLPVERDSREFDFPWFLPSPGELSLNFDFNLPACSSCFEILGQKM